MRKYPIRSGGSRAADTAANVQETNFVGVDCVKYAPLRALNVIPGSLRPDILE
jgi:hypothetical protein